MSGPAPSPPGYFTGEDYEGLMRCVRCGLCLPHCPTYREIGSEMASPRGRLALMKAVADGAVAPDEHFERHMHLCLGCRACEPACPSGVPFGHLMEISRETIEPSRRISLLGRAARFVGFRILLPHPSLLDLSLWPLRLADAVGLRALAGRRGVLRRLAPRLADLDAMLPRTALKAPGLSLPAVIPPEGPRRARVALFAGCVMDALFTGVNRDTAEVLRRNGCEVIVPRGQGCCGALHVHEGRREEGARLARRNLAVFDPADVDAIIVNAAGCGAVLKEQGALLQVDPGVRALAERVAAKVRDVTEFLAALGLQPPRGGFVKRIVYDAPCHLLHAQRVPRAPLEVLRAIPGVEVIEGPDSAFCCGSAGIYNLTHPEVATAMLDRKMKAIAPLDPDLVASGNPGCLLQLRLGVARAGLRAEVRHPIEILAAAYRAGDANDLPAKRNDDTF